MLDAYLDYTILVTISFIGLRNFMLHLTLAGQPEDDTYFNR